MTAQLDALARAKAEYEEKLRGLKAYARELKDMAAKHGTDEEHYGDALTRCGHDADYYEQALAELNARMEQEDEDTTFRVYKDASGEWRWQLTAANNRIIADSGEGYQNKQDCLAAIELVKNSKDAPVKEKS